MQVLTTVFLANTVDYGELKNDRRDESVIFSMQTFVVKLASGLAALIVSICLSVFRISSDTSTDTVVKAIDATSKMGLCMTMTILPILGLIIATIVFRKHFMLDEKKVEEIVSQIKEKRGASE